MSLRSFFKTMFGLGQKVEVIKDSVDIRDDKLENIFLNRDNNILASLRELSMSSCKEKSHSVKWSRIQTSGNLIRALREMLYVIILFLYNRILFYEL